MDKCFYQNGGFEAESTGLIFHNSVIFTMRSGNVDFFCYFCICHGQSRLGKKMYRKVGPKNLDTASVG